MLRADPEAFFLKALRREATPYPPTWLMRQAGRYLPSYRATRARAGSFLALCQTPELAMEVTLQPVERFDLDAAIVFSDILTIPDAMGLDLEFIDGEGPRLNRPLQDEAAVKALAVPDMAHLRYVFDAVNACRKALKPAVPLIGFAGSPFTLACYMVEGHGGSFSQAISLMYQRADLFGRIVQINTEAVSAYLTAQIEAGADCVMLFDSWGGLLNFDSYCRFSLEPMARVIASLPPQTPTIVFSKGGGHWLPEQAAIGATALGLDWTVNPRRARSEVGHKVALQGNLDPLVMTTDERSVRQQVRQVCEAFGPAPGHIFNLGHGITPQAKWELVHALVDEVRTKR